MQSCEHPHDLACDRCNLFPAIFQVIESVLEAIEIPLEEREELKYIITQSRRNIDAWKAHLLRSVNQDEARIDVLNAKKRARGASCSGLGNEVSPQKVS